MGSPVGALPAQVGGLVIAVVGLAALVLAIWRQAVGRPEWKLTKIRLLRSPVVWAFALVLLMAMFASAGGRR
jgi:hypothetical protein